MTYLVTGGGGFIGSYVVRDLAKMGQHVVVYDLIPNTSLLDDILSSDDKAHVHIVQGDILDLLHFLDVVKSQKVERIVHLAGLLATASDANPSLAIRVNCEGMCNVFEAARLFGLVKVVWASSVRVFGLQEEVMFDDSPHHPPDIYSACKSFDETLAIHYSDRFGVDNIGLRFPVVYGLGQTRGLPATMISEAIIKPAAGKAGKVPFGDDTLNWLYVEDTSAGVVACLRAGKTKTRVFNISGDTRAVSHLVACARHLFPDAVIELEAGSMGIGGKYDAARLREEVGFQAAYTLEKGLAKIAEIVRGNVPLVSPTKQDWSASRHEGK